MSIHISMVCRIATVLFLLSILRINSAAGQVDIFIEAKLQNAAQQGDLEQVKRILHLFPELLNRPFEGNSPLNWAVSNNRYDLARFLVEQGADVNQLGGQNGHTVPILEARTSRMARLLIENGAVIAPSALPHQKNPLKNAAENSWVEVVEVFLKAGLPMDFETAVDLGRIDDVKQFLKEKPWLAKPPFHALYDPAIDGNLELARVLLEHGADPNLDMQFVNVSGPFTPLTNAVHRGHLEMTKLLLEAGADPNVSAGRNHDNLFVYAIAYRNLEFVREMLKHGADIRASESWSSHSTPLHVAAALGGGAGLSYSSRVGQPRTLVREENEALQKTQLLIDHGADVNSLNVNGASPLLSAALAGNRDICDLLISRGARLDVYSACVLGRDKDVVRLLDDDPEIVNSPQRPVGYSILHFAAQYGSTEIVRTILDRGADVMKTSPLPSYTDAGGYTGHGDEGFTPLHLATMRGNLEIVRLLVRAGANINATLDNWYDGKSPLCLACSYGHTSIAKFLLEEGAIIDFENELPDYYDATRNPEILKLLLDASKINDLNNEMGYELIQNGIDDPAIIEIVQERGGRLNIFQAAQLGKTDVVKQLLNEDPSRAVQVRQVLGEETPLGLAVKNGHIDVVKTLFEFEADSKWKAEERTQLLENAVSQGHLEIVQFLISKGYSVKSLGYYGTTMLHTAAYGAWPDVIEFLLDHGLDPNAADHNGNLPLEGAIRELQYKPDELKSRSMDSVRILIDRGANVRAADNWGFTPLHEAARKGRIDVAAQLIERGADVNARNHRYETPLTTAKDANLSYGFSYASGSEYRSLIQLLKENGGVE